MTEKEIEEVNRYSRTADAEVWGKTIQAILEINVGPTKISYREHEKGTLILLEVGGKSFTIEPDIERTYARISIFKQDHTARHCTALDGLYFPEDDPVLIPEIRMALTEAMYHIHHDKRLRMLNIGKQCTYATEKV